MAFRKTNKKTYKKKTYKKRTYKRAGNATAKKALSIALRLKDQVGVEYKEYQSIIGNIQIGDGTNNPGVDGPGTVTALPLCTPYQGSNLADRLGDSIKLQRLTLRGHIAWLNQAAPASGTVTANIRLILFRGKNCENKSWPTTVDFGTGEKAFLDQLGVHGAKTDDNKYNSKILLDKVYSLDIARKNYITVNWNFPLNWYQQFKKDLNPTGSTDIVQGGLYLIVLSDTGTSAKCEFLANYCVTFTDS